MTMSASTGHLHGIVIELVVRRELVIPFQLAGVGVQRDHRTAVEIVAHADIAVLIRARVADAPIGEVERRIVGARHPYRCAAGLPGIARPGFVTRLRRGREWC